MTDDERRDLLGLKAFLERALEKAERDLLAFPTDGSTDDYRFLINKAVIYRENYKTVIALLLNDYNNE